MGRHEKKGHDYRPYPARRRRYTRILEPEGSSFINTDSVNFEIYLDVMKSMEEYPNTEIQDAWRHQLYFFTKDAICRAIAIVYATDEVPTAIQAAKDYSKLLGFHQSQRENGNQITAKIAAFPTTNDENARLSIAQLLSQAMIASVFHTKDRNDNFQQRLQVAPHFTKIAVSHWQAMKNHRSTIPTTSYHY